MLQVEPEKWWLEGSPKLLNLETMTASAPFSIIKPDEPEEMMEAKENAISLGWSISEEKWEQKENSAVAYGINNLGNMIGEVTFEWTLKFFKWENGNYSTWKVNNMPVYYPVFWAKDQAGITMKEKNWSGTPFPAARINQQNQIIFDHQGGYQYFASPYSEPSASFDLCEAFNLTDNGKIVGTYYPGLFAMHSTLGGSLVSLGKGQASAINEEADLIVGAKKEFPNWPFLSKEAAIWKKKGDSEKYIRYDANPLLQKLELKDWKVDKLHDVNQYGLASGLGAYQGSSKAIMMIPAELGVDANRDGKIVLLNEKELPENAGYEVDRTQEGKYYRFWSNDDDDTNDGDQIPPNSLDKDDDIIDCKRDLEDFTRLWVYLKGVHEMVKGDDAMLVGLKWKDTTGTPAIRLFEASEQDGDVKYLKEESIANQQAGIPYGLAVTDPFSGNSTVNSGEPFIFPHTVWEQLDEENYKKYFLFEGVSEGKGKLQLIFLDKNQNEIGEAPPIYLEISNVRKMYERAKAMPEGLESPYQSEYTFDENVAGYVQDPWNWPFEKPDDEEETAVVFVHGFNVFYNNYLTSADTFFKRLWHQNYKGRFASLRWDTLALDQPVPIGIFNECEYRAWKYGVSLKKYISSFPAGYSRSVAGHSMGNTVTGSALEKGMTLNNYIAMQGALPAGCYDTSESINNVTKFKDAEITNPTPDTKENLGYRGYLTQGRNNVSGTVANFFNPSDFALGPLAWELNQINYKPDSNNLLPGVYYSYYVDHPVKHDGWLFNGEKNIDRTVGDPHESMAFIARSRSKALGREGATEDMAPTQLNVAPFNFGGTPSEHSAQFNKPIQDLDEFYKMVKDIVE